MLFLSLRSAHATSRIIAYVDLRALISPRERSYGKSHERSYALEISARALISDKNNTYEHSYVIFSCVRMLLSLNIKAYEHS